MRKFSVSNDPDIYEAFPDVALAPSGRLVCVFLECTHHGDRSYTRAMLTDSTDRGRTWSPKRPLTEPLHCEPPVGPNWNCPRISTLSDGRLVAVVDRVAGRDEGNSGGEQSNWLLLSDDEGESWTQPSLTPVYGIVPDQLIELKRREHAGRWVLSAHTVLRREDDSRLWTEQCWISDDKGESWDGPFSVAAEEGLRLCEGSVMELPGGELVCFMRENSGLGMDAYKSISRDGGRTWDAPVRFPIPGCHRPVAGMLDDELVMITHRYMQGGKGWLGSWTQNFFAALTNVESCLATERNQASTRILPIDFDRSPKSDLGYSGWVRLDDGEIYVVGYIVDDAVDKAQIRGYALTLDDFLLPSD